jgi:hypothetical protein
METVQTQSDRLAALLAVGAVLTILTGLVLGLFVSPFGYLAVAVGLIDFAWIGLIRAGRLGPAATTRRRLEDAGVEDEPELSENPYARED